MVIAHYLGNGPACPPRNQRFEDHEIRTTLDDQRRLPMKTVLQKLERIMFADQPGYLEWRREEFSS